MPNTQLDKQQMQAIDHVPFLAEFPFPEFHFQYEVMQNLNTETRQFIGEPYAVILFSHDVYSKTTVHVLESELWKLYEIRDNITKINDISNTVSIALDSSSILDMSRACRQAEDWFKEIKGENFTVGAGIFNDILKGFTGKAKVELLTRLSWITDRLHKGSGIVYIKPDEKDVLTKYYRFQLVYYRMLIGIIIAAKISI